MLRLGAERDEVSVVDDQRAPHLYGPSRRGHAGAARAAGGDLACGRGWRLHVGGARGGNLRRGRPRLPRPADHDRRARPSGAAPGLLGVAASGTTRRGFRTGARACAIVSRASQLFRTDNVPVGVVRLWGIAAAALIFVGPASAFSVCTGVRVDLTKAGPAPLTQIATFGDVVDWALTAPYPTTKIAFRDGSLARCRSMRGRRSVALRSAAAGRVLPGRMPIPSRASGTEAGRSSYATSSRFCRVRVVDGDSAVLAAGEVPTQIECNGGPFGWVPPVIEVEALLLQESYGESALAPFATATATGARGDFAMLVSPKIETTYQARLGNLLR